jgi:hypothetical protein
MCFRCSLGWNEVLENTNMCAFLLSDALWQYFLTEPPTTTVERGRKLY